MKPEFDLNAMVQKIQTLKQNAAELKAVAGGIVAVDRNINRISASIRVMELDICDAADILLAGD
ncbi:conserved hypothetical protein [Desulfosarcina cetonica]|uniref:hypothetical protein n=1 Tax=Desulfosarcina cetonica TaxID=90730 RepID=UPI0006D185DE|nr:hypothetical protein [Desulfosarcina cetonica]VTR64046.1 conserved hypothetical protein [Desulfosarcina cetonica]